jgi:hypothetical protein
MSDKSLGHQDHRSRQGACHNCGWTQTLRKVSGSEAALIRRDFRGGPRFGLRWLCEDCITDLTSVGQTQPAPVAAGAFRLRLPAPSRHRSVA